MVTTQQPPGPASAQPNDAASDAAPLAASFDIEVFYDGDCPLCLREIAMLRRLDRREKIRFTDIAATGFDPAPLGLDMPTMMAEIHGRLPDGQLIVGVEVFRRLYAAVGWTWIVAITRWPGVRQLLDVAYRFFARQRLRLTGRCDASGCEVK